MKKMKIQNRKQRKLLEIRSQNSMRKFGMDPKGKHTITTIYGEKTYSYKDGIIIKAKFS
jgi:hypothetical protein